MCYHTTQSKEKAKLEARFNARLDSELDFFSERTNGFTFPATPVITANKKEQIQLYRWGLIPPWAKDKTIRQYTLNAKIETLAEKPAFKTSLAKRCLVIADGFIEWQWLDPKGKKKQPYHITLPGNELFA